MWIANILSLNDIGIVLVVVVVLFGASRLPQIGKNLANGARSSSLHADLA